MRDTLIVASLVSVALLGVFTAPSSNLGGEMLTKGTGETIKMKRILDEVSFGESPTSTVEVIYISEEIMDKEVYFGEYETLATAYIERQGNEETIVFTGEVIASKERDGKIYKVKKEHTTKQQLERQKESPLSWFFNIALAQSTTTTFTASTTWIAPSGVTNIDVKCWGAGGGGGDSSGAGGGGGGGGAFASASIGVTPLASYPVVIGRGGDVQGFGADPTNGGDSTFATTSVICDGGLAGNLTVGGAGGSTANSSGTVEFAGGAGGTGQNANDVSGAGGGGAGANGAGVAGTNGGAGVGGASAGGDGGAGDNGSGGAGGAGGDGVGLSGRGVAGTSNALGGGGGGGGGYPAGGGGGSEVNDINLGKGANGQITITYTIAGATTPQEDVIYY